MRAYTSGTPTSANYRARWVASLQVYPAGHEHAGCTMPFRPHGPNVPYVCPSSWTHEDSARGGPADPPPWTGHPVPSSEPTVRLELQSIVDDLPKPITRAAGYVRLIHDHRAWEIMNRRDGSMFASFDEFCTAARPWGLGIPPAKLAAYLALKEES